MNTTGKTLSIFWQHAWKYPKYVIGLLVMDPIGVITFRLIPPLIAASIIERLGRGDYISGDFWGSFGPDILLYALFTFFGGVIAFRIVMYLTWKLETYVNRDLFRTMFTHLMTLDTNFHANNFSGSLVSRTNKLVGSYIRMADAVVFQFYPMIVSFIFVMVIMYSRSPSFVWSFLTFSVLFIISTFFLSKRVRVLSAKEGSAENKITGNLADSITNITAIKSFAAGLKEKRRFDKTTDFARNRGLNVMWATIRRDFAASIITGGIQVFAVIIGVIAVVNRNADIATVFLMISYTAYLTDHLWQFSTSTLRGFNRAIGDAHDATLTLSQFPEIKDPAKPEKSRIKRGRVDFNDVAFDHEDPDDKKDSLFHNLNLSIKPGEKIGLVGRSGGGKTTIVKLLLRFMDIDSGQILIDGQNIAQITQDDLRSSTIYVPQEPLLFHRSLAENINYGNADASSEEILKAAKLAHAHEFIEKLQKGYETLVGERGVKLSGGQRQRVAIARAMLKDAPILLLDEATSALDSESEMLIQDALWKLMENKTAIVIAHRLSTIQRMDRIVVLESGNIVEQGSHTELLAKKGTYAKLWKHQSGGFLDE